MNILELKYTIPGDDFTRAGEASSAIKRKLKQMGFPPDLIRNVSIATYEGEINSVIHANGGSVSVSIDDEAVTIVIEDTGKGIPDIEKAMQEGFSTAPDSVRSLGFGAGMGLPNMKKYTDEIHVESQVGKGTKVTMKCRMT
ncbi:MAG: anti-sigma regulatory factor [Oscillospiraceae bacterium]|nr:anti-sigma regulatory factor [Oscillospiraceae bacterium]